MSGRPWYGTDQFAIMPRGWSWLLKGDEEWKVAKRIAQGADKWTGEYFSTHANLSAGTRIHVRDLKETIKRLDAKAIISVKRGRYGYTYTCHECPPQDSGQQPLSKDSGQEPLPESNQDSGQQPLRDSGQQPLHYIRPLSDNDDDVLKSKLRKPDCTQKDLAEIRSFDTHRLDSWFAHFDSIEDTPRRIRNRVVYLLERLRAGDEPPAPRKDGACPGPTWTRDASEFQPCADHPDCGEGRIRSHDNSNGTRIG
jgi:hypothetical protein